LHFIVSQNAFCGRVAIRKIDGRTIISGTVGKVIRQVKSRFKKVLKVI
jgi:hypothetical protein